MKLLIVEDSVFVRDCMVELLVSTNNVERISVAGTLKEGLKYAACQPDLVILDVHLPDGNAIDAITEFKQAAPNMLIAIFTGDVTEFTRERSLQAGADWFFDKFLEFEKILKVVQEVARSD